MPVEERYELIKQQQRELILALCTDAKVMPDGFVQSKLLAAKNALVNKRARVCLQTCPLLASFGDRYDPLFHQYAMSNSLTNPSPSLDARKFVSDILERQEEIDLRLLQWFVHEEAEHWRGALCLRYCQSRSHGALCVRIGGVSLTWLRGVRGQKGLSGQFVSCRF